MKHFSLRLRIILLYNYIYYVLLFASLIFVLIKVSVNYNIKNINSDNFELVINDYKIKDKTITIYFDDFIGKYYVNNFEEIKYFKSNYSFGDKVLLNGKVSIPNNNTIPNGFNYKKYLYHKRINYIIKIDNIEIISKNNNLFLNVKNYIYKRIDSIKYNEYLYAFILGKSYYIDSDTLNNYKINGVTHLFALSGLHVSMFSNILIYIFNKLRLNEKLSCLLTSIFLLFFAFIASFTPSILRAVLFFILSSINKIYYFYVKPKYLLYIVFSLLVFINPYYIYDTGFILSFSISFFILLFNENYKIKNNILSILVISILSLFSSLPIVINMSYEINILGFINNIFFIPFVTYLVFPLSIIVVFVDKLSFLLDILISIMEYISKISVSILNLKLYFSRLNLLYVFLYYVLLILVVKRVRVRKIFILFIIFLYFKCYIDRNDYIYYIDVGQGDSILFVDKNKNSILIDTGGKVNSKNNLMKNNVIPFFKSIGLKRIDYLVLTHGDYDHMGEAVNLVNNFKVKKVIFNCGNFNTLETELIKLLKIKKIKYYSCIKELNIDNNKLYFLQTKEYDNENDNSNVIYTELDGYKFMFMGDSGVEKEKDILNKYNISGIDVLKIGHHGSKTSSSKEFINEINPNYSIISVGKNNRYGHPNKEVLNNLSDSKIYRTDQDGSIMFNIKKNKLRIETYSP
ncbi:MAG: DNA internalization-related competence protein ComEC/Rec2 [Tenericutes bacterium]|nr:DNA internalization-related competence protein ComEC/Rec2 [Mycoplasmatota bacterium]